MRKSTEGDKVQLYDWREAAREMGLDPDSIVDEFAKRFSGEDDDAGDGLGGDSQRGSAGGNAARDGGEASGQGDQAENITN
jgi:hypothetical protein